jgi:hypothetical protein
MEEHILRYADIDTRCALGVYRRLPSNEFVFRPIPPESFRYWPEKRMVMYTNFYPDNYEFSVYSEISAMDDELWSPCQIVETRKNRRGDYTFCFTCEDKPFRFAGIPDVVVV